MIRFGTSGWRAVMGKDFTFSNVRIVVQAIANYLKKKFPGRSISVVANYDTRFLSERFALEAAKILSHNQIYTYLADRDAPSQAQALQVIKRRAQAGINFTASFNPPQYNGLKFNTETGAPALPHETDEVEKEILRLHPTYASTLAYPRQEYIEKINLQRDYLAFVQDKIDFGLIRRSKLRVAVDLLFGTSREYLDEILAENNIPLEEIHGFIDPYFGGVTPACTEENLVELKALVTDTKCNLGIATDADGDRFGIVDEKGAIVDQNLILSLLLNYVVSAKGWRGGVARSVATTHLVDRIARRYGLPLYRTPVGFKYLADLFLRGQIIFGGEESACLAVKDHLPEKDGIFAGLLVSEMLAATRLSLTELRADLFREYGERVAGQRHIGLTPEREKLLKKLRKSPPSKLDGRRVDSVETIDGLKLDLEDDDWVLLRLSGTEPLIRCYAEAGSKRAMQRLMRAGLELLG